MKMILVLLTHQHRWADPQEGKAQQRVRHLRSGKEVRTWLVFFESISGSITSKAGNPQAIESCDPHQNTSYLLATVCLTAGSGTSGKGKPEMLRDWGLQTAELCDDWDRYNHNAAGLRMTVFVAPDVVGKQTFIWSPTELEKIQKFPHHFDLDEQSFEIENDQGETVTVHRFSSTEAVAAFCRTNDPFASVRAVEIFGFWIESCKDDPLKLEDLRAGLGDVRFEALSEKIPWMKKDTVEYTAFVEFAEKENHFQAWGLATATAMRAKWQKYDVDNNGLRARVYLPPFVNKDQSLVPWTKEEMESIQGIPFDFAVGKDEVEILESHDGNAVDAVRFVDPAAIAAFCRTNDPFASDRALQIFDSSAEERGDDPFQLEHLRKGMGDDDFAKLTKRLPWMDKETEDYQKLVDKAEEEGKGAGHSQT